MRNGTVNFTRNLVRPSVKWRRVQLRRSFATSIRCQEDDARRRISKGSDYDERVRALEEGGGLARCYPRFEMFRPGLQNMPLTHFVNEYSSKLFPSDTNQEEVIQLSGILIIQALFFQVLIDNRQGEGSPDGRFEAGIL